MQTHTKKDSKPIPKAEAKSINPPSPIEKFLFNRQVLGILLSFMLFVGGIMGYFSMVKESDPDVQLAKAIISTEWSGTDAETIENRITDKLEDKIKSLPGLKKIKSGSFNSFSLVDVEFKAEAPVNESIQKLRGKMDDATPDMPPESEDREQPEFEQISQQDAPVLTLALYGENLDSVVLSNAAKELQDILEQVKNVRKVDLAGRREEVIHVQLIPPRLIELGISANKVKEAIEAGNQDMSWDRVRDNAIGGQIRLYGRFRTLDDLKQLPVARLNENRVVRLEEVAEVRRDLERETNRAAFSWQGEEFVQTINVDVVKVPGTDSIKVITDSLAAIKQTKQDPNLWPQGMEYKVINNDGEYINNDLFNLGNNVLQASICVFIILLFALTWKEAAIAGLAIPLTFLGAILVLWLGGQTLNNMVLVGMILALGLMVDVFIVILEGIHDGIFVQKLSFNRAAIQTVRANAIPALAGQLTTILAMAPLMAISGSMGKFVRLIPLSAIVCLVLSYVIALLIIVPLSKFLLGNVKADNKATFIDRLTVTATEKFTNWTLNNTVRNRKIARLWTMGTVALLVFSLVLASQLSFTLFPDSDQRKLSINVELAPTTTIERSQAVADEIGAKIRNYSDPNGNKVFASSIKLVGKRSDLISSGEIKPETADYFVGFSAIFTTADRRTKPSYIYVKELREELAQILDNYPDSTLAMQYQKTGDTFDPIQVELSGADMDVLREMSAQVQQALREIPGTMDVRDDLGGLQTDYKYSPRREALDFYGLSQNEVAWQGRSLFIDTEIGEFPIGSGEEDLKIQLSSAWPSQDGAVGGPSREDEFAMMRVITPQGKVISADSVLDLKQDLVPLSINHRNTIRTVTVLAKNIPGTGIYDSDILVQLQPKLDKMQEGWSQGYQYKFGGDAETSSETFGSAGIMLIVAIFLVFALLVLQFASYTQPFIIMLTIPFATIGLFVGFWLFNIPFSFPAMIGVISLTGIVVNNAIFMVDRMNARRQEGMDVRNAAAFGSSDRLRPILTTSLTTVIGLLPLAFSEAKWFPLCMAIIFGLVSSTLIAFFVVPGLYLQLTSNKAISQES
ncbi:putative Multidrug resistance protein [Hyella patelloides LEGE 07179]|uniref:Putative Multidrug resistance protein n=1 Tax=Hyella patelloides LEGE 07179 TaxID=945734 RepID=A0A563VSE3_9CYAN|nr:efflux RND transporter permease subunit [Hyella patelloides]VEP14316.1 putative Multidrug resistance protein [Hyella patelloides LEGE 07179]VEP14419.1 putative Multidrug resistance protein [Hyella patelloides LEGE 07179]